MEQVGNKAFYNAAKDHKKETVKSLMHSLGAEMVQHGCMDKRKEQQHMKLFHLVQGYVGKKEIGRYNASIWLLEKIAEKIKTTEEESLDDETRMTPLQQKRGRKNEKKTESSDEAGSTSRT